jgi:hypothetical protein
MEFDNSLTRPTGNWERISDVHGRVLDEARLVVGAFPAADDERKRRSETGALAVGDSHGGTAAM